ncbi:hypothetical protein CANMA_002575 [Candida margitis]|uniref:uncharacterized protein n=1 Tax=Candida margitis TaxID=1775924 RepID=UPI0022267A8F|nr:uncharacterized protein CANMA_002575 [Candida margitis]KAI5968073.1 hypothetical protein CANMA_002575 [Candida margitis]
MGVDTDQIGIWCTNSDGSAAYTGAAYETQRWACMLVVLTVLVNTVLGLHLGYEISEDCCDVVMMKLYS